MRWVGVQQESEYPEVQVQGAIFFRSQTILEQSFSPKSRCQGYPLWEANPGVSLKSLVCKLARYVPFFIAEAPAGQAKRCDKIGTRLLGIADEVRYFSQGLL